VLKAAFRLLAVIVLVLNLAPTVEAGARALHHAVSAQKARAVARFYYSIDVRRGLVMQRLFGVYADSCRNDGCISVLVLGGRMATIQCMDGWTILRRQLPTSPNIRRLLAALRREAVIGGIPPYLVSVFARANVVDSTQFSQGDD
jgi:hypothetical protein